MSDGDVRQGATLQDAVAKRLVRLPDGREGVLTRYPMQGPRRDGAQRDKRGAKATVKVGGRHERWYPADLTVLLNA